MAKAADVSAVISSFRAIEANEDAIPVLGDEDAMRVLAAWSKTDQQWKRPRRKPPEMTPTNHALVWSWLVEGWSIDHGSIAKAAGVRIAVAHEKMEMIIRNRLVYPDGSMSKAARTALNVHVAAKLGIKQKAPRTPRAGAKDENAN